MHEAQTIAQKKIEQVLAIKKTYIMQHTHWSILQ